MTNPQASIVPSASDSDLLSNVRGRRFGLRPMSSPCPWILGELQLMTNRGAIARSRSALTTRWWYLPVEGS